MFCPHFFPLNNRQRQAKTHVAAAEARGCVGLRRAAQRPPRAVLRTRNAASCLGSCYRGINRVQNRGIPSIAVMSPHFTNDVIAIFVAAAEARGCVGLHSPEGGPADTQRSLVPQQLLQGN